MSLSSGRNQPFEIYRKNALAAGYHPVETWTRIKSDMCRRRKVSSRERIASDGSYIDIDEAIYILPTDITEDDLIKMGGRYYKIYEINNPAYKDRHYRLFLTRQTTGFSIMVV